MLSVVFTHLTLTEPLWQNAGEAARRGRYCYFLDFTKMDGVGDKELAQGHTDRIISKAGILSRSCVITVPALHHCYHYFPQIMTITTI